MKWKDSLTKFRQDRRILKPSGKFVTTIEEELQEYVEALKSGDTNELIDAIADVIVLSANELALNGYDLDLVMKKVAKHINERPQDPEQASRDWSDEKWKKDPNFVQQPVDYSTCKLKGK